ncbi:hypothetical protein SY88_22820 [Clostridiales bacterium PH28_bin88]|nr:hypothetical protein SY88_22820 [Clostridiales bacterium PH28_bin88]
MSYNMSECLYMMYPEVYYKIYPVVRRVCAMYDDPANPEMNPYPTRAAVERMADYVYNQVVGELESSQVFGEIDLQQDGRRLLRALILVLLIRELLRRR